MATTGSNTKYQESHFHVESLQVDQDATIGGDLTVTGSGVHGQLYESSAGSVITVTSTGTYYGWTTATEGETNGGITFDGNATADRLVLGIAGTYEVVVQVSFGATGGAVVEGAIHKNNVIQTQAAFTRVMGVGGDIGSASLVGLVTSDGDDFIDLRFTSDDNGDTVTVYKVSLVAVKI